MGVGAGAGGDRLRQRLPGVDPDCGVAEVVDGEHHEVAGTGEAGERQIDGVAFERAEGHAAGVPAREEHAGLLDVGKVPAGVAGGADGGVPGVGEPLPQDGLGFGGGVEDHLVGVAHGVGRIVQAGAVLGVQRQFARVQGEREDVDVAVVEDEASVEVGLVRRAGVAGAGRVVLVEFADVPAVVDRFGRDVGPVGEGAGDLPGERVGAFGGERPVGVDVRRDVHRDRVGEPVAGRGVEPRLAEAGDGPQHHVAGAGDVDEAQ